MRLATGARFAAASALIVITTAPLAAHAEVAGGVIDCDAPGGKQVGGALLGAVIGGIAGSNLAKHDRGAGTVIGATAGAATGSYVGCKMQKNDAAKASEAPSRARREADDEDSPRYAQRRDDADDARFLPPGLAKKAHGMPPGLAKKYYAVGDQLPVSYVREPRRSLEAPVRYGLRYPPEGYRWVVVDRDAYLVRTRTGLIADVARAILD